MTGGQQPQCVLFPSRLGWAPKWHGRPRQGPRGLAHATEKRLFQQPLCPLIYKERIGLTAEQIELVQKLAGQVADGMKDSGPLERPRG